MNPNPNAVFIGFQKAGSTLLRGYFSLHPQIQWTKKAIFFSLEDFEKQKQDYFTLLESRRADCYIDMHEALAVGYLRKHIKDWGEKDVDLGYAATHPFSQTPVTLIPSRIHQLLPQTKIIITLRNQIDWLRSNYIHVQVRMPANKRRFHFFLQTIEGERLLAAGYYNHILEAYFDIFGREKVFVLPMEELASDLEKALQKLCTFLDIDYHPYPKSKQTVNTGHSLLRARLVEVASRFGLDARRLRRLSPLISVVDKRASSFGRPIISQRELEWLNSKYAASNKITGEMLGVDLSQYGYTR
ncbi:MAG: sulfotransferase [Anaerolineales bacterium]